LCRLAGQIYTKKTGFSGLESGQNNGVWRLKTRLKACFSRKKRSVGKGDEKKRTNRPFSFTRCNKKIAFPMTVSTSEFLQRQVIRL
jgi:hypothetical protein